MLHKKQLKQGWVDETKKEFFKKKSSLETVIIDLYGTEELKS